MARHNPALRERQQGTVSWVRVAQVTGIAATCLNSVGFKTASFANPVTIDAGIYYGALLWTGTGTTGVVSLTAKRAACNDTNLNGPLRNGTLDGQTGFDDPQTSLVIAPQQNRIWIGLS